MRPGRAKPALQDGRRAREACHKLRRDTSGRGRPRISPTAGVGQQVVSPAEGGGGQLPEATQQIGRPDAPAAVSSASLPSSARVSRLRVILFAFFFIFLLLSAETGIAAIRRLQGRGAARRDLATDRLAGGSRGGFEGPAA